MIQFEKYFSSSLKPPTSVYKGIMFFFSRSQMVAIGWSLELCSCIVVFSWFVPFSSYWLQTYSISRNPNKTPLKRSTTFIRFHRWLSRVVRKKLKASTRWGRAATWQVDGLRSSKKPPRMYENLKKNGINYQPQLVLAGSQLYVFLGLYRIWFYKNHIIVWSQAYMKNLLDKRCSSLAAPLFLSISSLLHHAYCSRSSNWQRMRHKRSHTLAFLAACLFQHHSNLEEAGDWGLVVWKIFSTSRTLMVWLQVYSIHDHMSICIYIYVHNMGRFYSLFHGCILLPKKCFSISPFIPRKVIAALV